MKATPKVTKQHICKAKSQKETNMMGKGYSNYKVRENELRQKEDHPKDPLDEYQWRIE
jgi:hypothetical protein